MESAPKRDYLSAKNLAIRGIPRLFFNATLDQYDIEPDIKQLFKNYLDNLPSMLSDVINLVLYGTNGSGKTYLACLIIKEAYRERYSSFIVTFQRLIDMHFKKEDKYFQERLQEIIESDFLVIDEIGKESRSNKSDYNVAILEEILRTRDTLGRPTILCMNLLLDEEDGFYEQYGSSVTSLVEGNFVKIKFTGKSFRYDVTKEKPALSILMEGVEDE